jgi:hypothetical protein
MQLEVVESKRRSPYEVKFLLRGRSMIASLQCNQVLSRHRSSCNTSSPPRNAVLSFGFAQQLLLSPHYSFGIASPRLNNVQFNRCNDEVRVLVSICCSDHLFQDVLKVFEIIELSFTVSYSPIAIGC